MQIKQLTDDQFYKWDQFVFDHNDATFFHRAGWKTVIEKSFGHPTYFFYVEENGQIQGILPLGHVKSRLFGNALISTPFSVYGGIVANGENAKRILEEKAIELASQLNVDYLEMRNIQSTNSRWTTKDLYVTFRKHIDTDPVKNFEAIPRKQRAMVKKGIKAGLSATIDEGVDRLYDAYSQSVHNLGTPVFPKNYFAAIPVIILLYPCIKLHLRKKECVSQISRHVLSDDYDAAALAKTTLYQICEQYSRRYNIPSLVDAIYHSDNILRHTVFTAFVLIVLILPINTTLQRLLALLFSYQIVIIISNASIIYRRLK